MDKFSKLNVPKSGRGGGCNKLLMNNISFHRMHRVDISPKLNVPYSRRRNAINYWLLVFPSTEFNLS